MDDVASAHAKLKRRVKTLSGKSACTLDFDADAPCEISIQLAVAAFRTLKEAGVEVTFGQRADALLSAPLAKEAS